MADGVDQRVKVEGRQVGILRLDEDDVGCVVPRQVDVVRHVVVQVGEGDAVFGADRLPNDDLVDVVELIPVLVLRIGVLDQRLELGPARNGHVERFGREERLEVEQIKVVVVDQVRQQLVRQSVERGQLRHGQVPAPVRRAVDVARVHQRLRVVEPALDRLVFVAVQLHLDRLQRFHVQNVVGVVERRLLVVERREAHAFEVASVALLAPHHDPHRAPLRHVHRLNHPRNLIDEADCA